MKYYEIHAAHFKDGKVGIDHKDGSKLKPGVYDFNLSCAIKVREDGTIRVLGKIVASAMDSRVLSRNQQNLIRGLERVLYVVMNGRTASARQYESWHEECLRAFAPLHKGVLNVEVPVRTGDMTKQEASDYANCLIGEILCGDQRGMMEHFDPAEVSTLFKAFHTMYFEDLDFRRFDSWDDYREKINFCEFTFSTGSLVDPLERMHIISAGANGTIYEEPWNWIHACHSVHMRQHTEGWDSILNQYPHMIPRIEFAREMERRKQCS